MAGKGKHMSTPQKEVDISLFDDGVNQRQIAEILGVSQSSVWRRLKRFYQRESCENERQKDSALLENGQTTTFAGNYEQSILRFRGVFLNFI